MYLAGYPREEIAELMGWTEGKTRNLLYRGLADLRARLTELGIGWQQRRRQRERGSSAGGVRRRARRRRRWARARHVSPEAIAALARREGSETERLATLDHVMSCRECRAEFDLLRAVEQAGAQSGRGEERRRRTWFVPAALAATLLLAVGVGRMVTKPGSDDVTRGGEAGALSSDRSGHSTRSRGAR